MYRAQRRLIGPRGNLPHPFINLLSLMIGHPPDQTIPKQMCSLAWSPVVKKPLLAYKPAWPHPATTRQQILSPMSQVPVSTHLKIHQPSLSQLPHPLTIQQSLLHHNQQILLLKKISNQIQKSSSIRPYQTNQITT